MSQPTSGLLKLTVVEARLTRNVEWMGHSMDPYVALKYRMQEVKTSTQDNAHKEPIWNETLDLDIKYIGDDIELKVFDEERMGAPNLIGETQIKVSALIVPGIDDWWVITHKGKEAGKVHLKGDFKGTVDPSAAKASKGDQMQQQQQMPMGGMQQQMPMGGMQQQMPMGGMQQQPMMGGGYGMQQPMGGMQQQPMMGGMQQQQPMMGGGYGMQQPMGGMQQQPMMGGMQQQPMMGGGYGMQQQPMMGGGYGMQQPMQQQTQATFFCPKCRQQLFPDPTAQFDASVECDVCSRKTSQVLSCRPCDYDLCYPCASKRS